MIEIFLTFIVGTIIGSFLNCVVYRLENEESFVSGSSYCPHCKHNLNFSDLFPIFSFLFLKGKCRYCNQKISLQYPIVEFCMGMLFVLNYLNFSNNPIQFVFYCLISFFMALIFIYDLKHCLVPVDFVYYGIFATLFFHLINFYWVFLKASPQNIDIYQAFSLYFFPYFIGALIPFSFFWFLNFVSKGTWMGLGDSKIGFLIGFVLGKEKVLISLLLAVFLGAIMGLILIILAKLKMKSEMPFGPFLILGFYAMAYFGELILDFLKKIFFAI